MTNLAIAANGLRKSYGDKVVLDGVDLAVPEGTIFSLLGPNGAGKTTAVKILSTLISPDPASGDIRVGGHDLATDPQAVRAAIGVTGQFSAVDGLITGEENMLLMARPAPPVQARGPPRRRRAAGALRPRRRREEARLHLLRRHEAPPRPRHDPGRQPADHLPRRAHHRPRPPQPPQHVADHPRARRRAAPPSSSPPSTWRRPTNSPTVSPCSTTARLAAEGTAEELKRLIPGGHVRLRFTDPAAYQSAAFALRDATRDDESLALQIPSDGSQRELRSILDRLDSAGIEADELTVHTPDLDDVFFALTGARRRPQPAQGGRPMSSLSLAVRDSSTMLRRNLLHARRYPSLTLNLLLTPIMLLLLFVYIFGDTMSAGIGGGARPLRLHRLSSSPACC